MSFQFSLFDNLTEEKPLFFFTTLHYPKELMTYCKKSELPLKYRCLHCSQGRKKCR